MNTVFTCAAVLLLAGTRNSQAVTFDDFNVNEGHFSSTITFSGTTVGEDASSTADRVTTDSPREGAGHQRLVLVHDATATPFRLRHVSGGGTVANNTAFTTTAGTDGYIGFYLKTTNTGWQTSINLDGAGGTGADMDGSTSIEVIADGEWHLYEWNLDSTTDWGAIPGIGGGHGGSLLNGSHTIDSIYLRDLDGSPGPTAVIFFDFVALNPNGSVADLLLEPCLATSGVGITGPISTNSNQVVVTAVSAAATNITVYQNTGPSSSMIPIGSKTTGITAGNNLVTVSGLVKGAIVSATQTYTNQESCIQTNGVIVGGGANPSVKITLNIRETSSTGPVGGSGDTTSANIHFLGASTVTGGAPANAQVFYPSNVWQTLTFQRGTNEIVGDSANASGALASATGYAANDTVSIQAYAYRTLANGVTIYSATPATSSDVTSNDVFTVSWTWDAVAGANGYRLLRQVNFTGYNEFRDLAVNSLNDANTGWAAGSTVTPTTSQPGRSVQWSPSVSNPNNLPGQWGILEALNFQVDGDTGPFDVYVDNLTSGSTTWQDFEAATVGAQDISFRHPGFSGFPAGNILGAPDQSIVSDTAADTGNQSLRLRFQWKDTVATRWVRITTSGVGNPMVNLDDPITIRLLMLPVGSSPVPPASPVTITGIGGGQLSYTGGGGSQFVLIKSANVTAPSATWTREATNTTTPGSFSIPVGSEAAAFYRVKSE